MKKINSGILIFVLYLAITPLFAQKMIVVSDTTRTREYDKASAAEEKSVKEKILPKLQKYWAKNDSCNEDFEISGVAKGSFSKPKSNQTLIFYQYCVTGNGFANVGLTLFEDGKILGNYVMEGGWAVNIKTLPDINQNGLSEFLLYWSGGMHQGKGGVGVDLGEFGGAKPKILGWFQDSRFDESADEYTYKVYAKPAKNPTFYREKYLQIGENKYRKQGKLTVFKLKQGYGEFKPLN